MAINSAGGAGGTSNVFGNATIKAAWDQFFELALRHQVLHRDRLVSKHPVDVTNPGSTVTLFTHADIPVSTDDPVAGAMQDLVDPTATTFATPTSVDVTVREYGRVMIHSKFLKINSLTNVMKYQSNQVAYDQAQTLDRFVRRIARGGTFVTYATGGATTPTSPATVAAEDTLASDDIRSVVADLQTAAVQPTGGDELYVGIAHPHVLMDLRRETGATAWRDPHVHSAPGPIWTGEVGVYEGVRWVQSGRSYTANDGDPTGGPGGVQAWNYRTLIYGDQAVAEATAIEPGITFVEKVGQDYFERQYALGWYGILGWNIFRDVALRRIESGSSKNGFGISGTSN